MQGQTCCHARTIMDTRHVMVVALTVHGQLCRVYILHMPHRSHSRKYRAVLRAIRLLRAREPDAYEVYLGDRNGLVPEHADTVIFMVTSKIAPVCNGTERRLHKDCALVSCARTPVAKVTYDAGLVTIHPMIILAVCFEATAAGGRSTAYRPVTVGPWKAAKKTAFSDLLEAFSQFEGRPADWLARYRDVMGAVEAHRRAGQETEDRLRTQKFMDRIDAGLAQHPATDGTAWNAAKHERAWLSMVKERGLLMRASMHAEAAAILRLKKAVPFSSISPIWDCRKQRLVSGDELRDAVGHEASLRHPPVPAPVPRHWVLSHLGPTTLHAERRTKVQQAAAAQAMRVSAGQIRHGVGYAPSVSKIILTAMDQTSPTATMDWYAPALAACMGL